MENLEISLVNEILKALGRVNLDYHIPEGFKKIDETNNSDWKRDGYNMNGEHTWILKYKDIFVEVTEFSNSYGSVDENRLIQFVKPITKTVTAYSRIEKIEPF